MLLKGSEFLYMALIEIAFLVLINLVSQSFSYVLMQLVKFNPSVEFFALFLFKCHLALCVYLFLRTCFSYGYHWSLF